MHANSVKCALCKQWIYKRYGGVRDDLPLVVDGFRCKQCNGTNLEADIAEDLVVDGDIYGCVKRFCYLGDTLDGDGGAVFATTARIRNGWMNFRELLLFLSPRRSSVYLLCHKQHDL